MAFSLSNIILTDRYNFSESRKNKAFEEIERNGFPLDYSIYRLKYFILNLVLNTVLNSILFISYYKTKSFDLFYIHIILALFLQFWWGATHVLIKDVKNRIYFNDKGGTNRLFNGWLANSVLAGSAVFLLLLVVLSSLFPEIKFPILFFVLIRFMFKYIYRLFYSLVFALNRVYTPFYFILATDLVFVSIIYFAASHGNMAVNLLLLLLSLANFILFSFIAVKQAQKLDIIDIGYYIKRLRAFDIKPVISFNKQFCLLGMAAVAISSNLLIMLNANTSKLHTVFIILPFIITCQNWIRPFYFDLTDIKVLLNTKLRRNYIKYLFKNLPFIASMIIIIYLVFCRVAEIDMSTSIILFAIISACFSVFVYDNFSKGNMNSLFVILSIELLIILLSEDFYSTVNFIILFRAAAIVYFIINGSGSSKMLNDINFVVPLDIWQDSLSQKDDECNIHVLKFNANIKKAVMNSLSRRIALLVGNSGKVGMQGKFLIIYSYSNISQEQLISAAEGAIIYYKEYKRSEMPADLISQLGDRQQVS